MTRGRIEVGRGEGETKQSLLSDSLMQSYDCLCSTVILLSPVFYDFNREVDCMFKKHAHK